MKTKTFDCVGMKRAAQARIRDEISNMTMEEQLAFFRAGAEEFERRIQTAKQRLAKVPGEPPPPPG